MTTGQLRRRQTEISQFSTEHAMEYMLGFNLRVVKMWLDASARHVRRMSHSKCHVNVSRHNMSEKIHSLYHSIIKQKLILTTEDSFYIYKKPPTEINVISSFCALNLRIKF